MISQTTTGHNRIARRPARMTTAGLWCLAGLALTSPASAQSSLDKTKTVLGVGPVAFPDYGTSTGGGSAASTVTPEQIKQIQQITESFTLGGERGHLKDPDLLDGDNPGWTNPPTKRPTTSSPTESPTKRPTTSSPTSSPTKRPTTSSPTSSPTKRPTTSSPTESPTKRPTTSSPTESPTKRPTTSSPTSSPTKRPTTSSPTESPTPGPTTTSPTSNPTAGPTSSPTESPTPGPTTSPTIDPCQISSGTYSYFHPDALSSSLASEPMAIEVPFVYEVETAVEYSAGEMNGEILPQVEQALGDGLLPLMFDECAVSGGASGRNGGSSTKETAGGGATASGEGVTGTGNNAGSGRSNPLTDGRIVGITTSPPDLAVTDADAICTTTQTRQGTSCTVVEGTLTVYAPTESTQTPSGDGSQEQEEQIDVLIGAVQDAIQEVMDSGMLNDGAVDESIETVAYGRDGPYREPIVALGTGEGESGTRGDTGIGFPVYIAIAGGAAAVAVALFIVGAKMRSRQNEDKDYYDSGDDEGFDGDENDVSGFHDNPTEVAERGGKSMYDMSPVAASADDRDANIDGQINALVKGGDWASVGTTAVVLASAPDAEAAADDGWM